MRGNGPELMIPVARRLDGLFDPVTRGWVIVASGSFARLALGLITSIVIARTLGPSAFGVYAILAATGTIIGGLADAGLTSAAVRRIAATEAEFPGRAQEIWRTFFWLRMSMAGAISLCGMLAAGPLAGELLGLPGYEWLLRLTLVGIAATALAGTISTLLQATGHFGRLSVVMLTNASLTVVLAVVLAAFDALTLTTAIVMLGIATSLASFIVGYRLVPGYWPLGLPARSVIDTDGRDLLRFAAWLWIAGIFAMLAAQLDVLLVNRWADAAVVGAYALALSLASKAEVVNHSLHAVLLPAASALRDSNHVRDYVRRGLVRSGAIVALLLMLIPLAGPFITTVYGPAYQRSVALFQGLLVVAMLEVCLAPVLMLAFTYDRPRLLAVSGIARVSTLVLAAAWLIPSYGPSGAVVARLAGTIIGGGVMLGALLRGRSASPDETVDLQA